MLSPNPKNSSALWQISIPDLLRVKAEAAAIKAGSLEACALLTGYRNKKCLVIQKFHISDNVCDEPDKGFEIDAKLQLDLFKKARRGQYSVIGVWHSHPSGDEYPSQIDALAAHDPNFFWWISAERHGTLFHSYHMAPLEPGGVFREVTLI